ncbi:sulfotransferase 1C2-like [Glandiceps talaboti]
MASNKKNEWPGFSLNGCYFIEHMYDKLAITERRLDNLWDMRDSDVIISTYQKSGTHWMINAISQMFEDMNYKVPGTDKPGCLGYLYEKTDDFVPGMYGEHVRNVKRFLKKMPSPRLFSNHLPPQLFHTAWKEGERKCKIIYITRNAKDVCVSLFHYMKALTFTKMELTWDEWVEAFVEGKVNYGSWLDHVQRWGQYGLKDNVLHVSFEDMKRDLTSTLRKVSRFLGRPISDNDLEKVVSNCSFASMKANTDTVISSATQNKYTWKEGNSFFRKGEVGDWKYHFTVAQNEYFDRYVTGVCSCKDRIEYCL